MAFAVFGPGIAIVTRTDTATPIAINVGFVQELELDLSGTTKQLYGQNQFPLVAARSTIKATGKFKSAEVSGLAWNAFFFGSTLSTANGITWNVDSTFTVSTSAVTLQVGSSLTFDADLGMRYSSNGLPLQRVSTGLEATGKYSVSATGLYTFAAGDQAATLKITYTSTVNPGQSMLLANQIIGQTPTFQLDYYTTLNQPTAKPFVVRVYQCVSSKFTAAFKLEDFMMPSFEFDFFANAAGNVMNVVYPEIG